MYENYSNIPFNAISYECNERLLSSESGRYHLYLPKHKIIIRKAL